MGIVIIYFILCIVAGSIGNSRKIGFWGAFLLSLFLSPLIGFICALASARKMDYNLEVMKMNQAFHSENETQRKARLYDELKKDGKL